MAKGRLGDERRVIHSSLFQKAVWHRTNNSTACQSHRDNSIGGYHKRTRVSSSVTRSSTDQGEVRRKHSCQQSTTLRRPRAHSGFNLFSKMMLEKNRRCSSSLLLLIVAAPVLLQAVTGAAFSLRHRFAHLKRAATSGAASSAVSKLTEPI